MVRLSKRQITGLKLKNLRESNGITQDDLAEKLDYSVHTISRIETGKANMSERFRIKVAEFFNVSELFFYDSNTQKTNTESEILIQCINNDLLNMKESTLKSLHAITKRLSENDLRQ